MMELLGTLERAKNPIAVGIAAFVLTAGCVDGESHSRVPDSDETVITQSEEFSESEFTEYSRHPADEDAYELKTEIEESDDAAEEDIEAGNVELYEVVGVVDGDTVKINYEEEHENVRLIGIDTPETMHPNKPVECFGREASAHAKDLLEGTAVEFVADSYKEGRDRFGRLLGYLTMQDGRDFGEVMIRDGFAFEYTYQGEEYNKQDIYQAAERIAMKERRGLWGESTCGGERKPEVGNVQDMPSIENQACDPNYTPCVPDTSHDLDCEDIGFPVSVVRDDRHRFDGDGDGHGCESY